MGHFFFLFVLSLSIFRLLAEEETGLGAKYVRECEVRPTGRISPLTGGAEGEGADEELIRSFRLRGGQHQGCPVASIRK